MATHAHITTPPPVTRRRAVRLALRVLKQSTQATGQMTAERVPPLSDDPDIATASDLYRRLSRALQALQKEKDLLALEAHFKAGPGITSFPGGGEREKMLWGRYLALKAELAVPERQPATTPQEVEADPVIKSALGVLSGEVAPPADDLPTRRAEVDRKIQIVDRATRIAGVRYDELRQDKSRDIALSLQPEHDALLLTIYRQAQELSRLIDTERHYRFDLVAKNYESRPDLIGPAPISALPMLGSERDHDSQISNFRRFLEQKGILP